jgi:DNA replication protein DnaC
MQQTLTKLTQLKLNGMREALEQQIAQPNTHDLSFEERLGLLVDHEVTSRDNRRLQRLLKAAGLKQSACVEDIDYRHARGLQRQQVASLAAGDWITKHQNMMLVGPTGCGKSYLACALGQQACRQGHPTLYIRFNRLLEQLRIAHGDGSFVKLMTKMAKTHLLIIDDWGLQKLSKAQANDVLELIEDRQGIGSTLITSQLPIENWYDMIGEPTLADAILDRLLHTAHKIILKGESMRKASKLDGS